MQFAYFDLRILNTTSVRVGRWSKLVSDATHIMCHVASFLGADAGAPKGFAK